MSERSEPARAAESGEQSGSSEVWGVILAGGSAARYGAPKQFLHLDGRPLIDWVLAAAASVTSNMIAVLPGGVEWELPPGVRRVDGGATRLDSARAALAVLHDRDDDAIVVIHDPAHPLASERLFIEVVDAVRAGADAAVPAVPMLEVTKVVDQHGWVVESQPKHGVMIAQAPQAFRLGALRRAHVGAPAGVEDSELVERAGGRVRVVPGDWANIHVTLPDELALAEAIVRGRKDIVDE
ncbi:MAG: 2-C-methyl-D-erythritol 4-phosphate cytidylyltransferase [Acidimicrobiia bacterium]